MIQSRLITGNKVFTSDIFPEICTCRMVTDDTVRTTYCDNPFLKTEMTEKRIGRFMVMNQRAVANSDCIFEVHRQGSPALMLSLANNSDFTRKHERERHWRTGDVGLSLSPQEEVVNNYAQKNSHLDMTNLIIPEPAIHQLAEKNPLVTDKLLSDFKKGASIDYGSPSLKANHKLVSVFNAINSCSVMGNYSEQYLEEKVLDGLTAFLNLSTGEPDLSMKYNFVLRSKMIDVKQILEANYKNPPRLAELAAMVCTNECTLKSAFKQLFGVTVFQHLFNFRMRLAQQQLADPYLPIQFIASELGFCDKSHFSAAFHRAFQMSPRDYRKQILLQNSRTLEIYSGL